MKLEEAIEILTKWREEESVDCEEELHKAEQLGIEALNSVQRSRLIFPDVEVNRLPGETDV